MCFERGTVSCPLLRSVRCHGLEGWHCLVTPVALSDRLFPSTRAGPCNTTRSSSSRDQLSSVLGGYLRSRVHPSPIHVMEKNLGSNTRLRWLRT